MIMKRSNDSDSLIAQRRERGKAIFNEYLRKFIANEYDSDEERDYIQMLIGSSDVHPTFFDAPIPKWKYYTPLEKAERTNGYLVKVPDVEYLCGSELTRFLRNLDRRKPKDELEKNEIDKLRLLAGSKCSQCDGWKYHWEVRKNKKTIKNESA